MVLDPGWLTEALDVRAERTGSSASSGVDYSWTIADKLASPSPSRAWTATATTAPCEKAHFNNGINSLLGEASFYRHLQPDSGVRTPQPHYTGIDPATNRGLIVMDDILTLGGRILDASEPYAVATCRDTLGLMAWSTRKTWGAARAVGRRLAGRRVSL